LGEDYDGDGVGGGRDLWGNEREEEEGGIVIEFEES